MSEIVEPLKNAAPEGEAGGSVKPAPAVAGPEPVPAAEASGTLVTPEEFKQLRDQAAKAEQNWELYLRARAELDNFRKRATRERHDAVRFAAQALAEKLVPVLDSFDMATLAVNHPNQSSLEALRQGVALVHSQLKAVLAEAGVQEIEAANQLFDPNLHEAVAHQESAEVPEGYVLQQLRKGYRLHDRLIRPATVVVAKAPVLPPA